MNTYEEKISLLSEMIAFSVVDGKLHQREYDFLWLIARELGVERQVFDDLFHQEVKPIVPRSETERIHQFYRLALLMHVDGVLHEREETAISQISINMGLNPSATKRLLKAMKESPTKIIDADLLFSTFREQQN